MYDGQGPDITHAARQAQRYAPRYQPISERERIIDGAIGALVAAMLYRVIHRNWHRAWVRATVAATLVFWPAWIVSCIGAFIVSAFVKPGDQADLVPILIWTAAASLVVAMLAAFRAIVGSRYYHSGTVSK